MDPTKVWLSDNFRLSDFLGNYSVYSRGFPNPFEHDLGGVHIGNARALCEHALEPVLAQFGPLSISYGFISPEFSRRTVTYQDPNKPSHHRWDLGAAADIVVHRWVQGLPSTPHILQLFADENTRTSPALLAHALEESGIPYSRLISYSESPYLCVAVSDTEVRAGKPRKAFYENRYTGKKKVKPDYLQLPSPQAKARVCRLLQSEGLPHPWQGGGYPSYHGGGIRQYQHIRTGKYSTMLDWLFNLKSISTGARNTPDLLSDTTLDSFLSAAHLLDLVVEANPDVRRFSVLGGFLSRSHPDYSADNDWKGAESICFSLGAPLSSVELGDRVHETLKHYPSVSVDTAQSDVRIRFSVREVAESIPG